MRYTTETREYSTPMVRVSDATGGTPTAASWATASDERNKRSGQLSAEKGRKFHNDLAGYPRQPRMPDKIPARGWKSQGKYPPRTTLPRTRHTSGRNDLHLGIIYQTVSIDYDRLFVGNMSFVHDIRRAELIASLVHDIRREEMICIDYFLGTQDFAYLGTQDFAYERGRDEAAARGLAAVGKLTEIVEVEDETWQGATFGVC